MTTQTPDALKHPQFILAANQSFFSPILAKCSDQRLPGFCAYNFDAFVRDVEDHLVIAQRRRLETDTNFRQLLPYVILRRINVHSEVEFLTYRRTKMVGEERLSMLTSVGFGGHIDMADIRVIEDSERDISLVRKSQDSSRIHLDATIRMSAEREIAEEVQLIGGRPYTGRSGMLTPANRLLLGTEGVHQVHAGILFYYDIPLNLDASCAEEELESLGFNTRDEIFINEKINPHMELWSKMFLDSLGP